MKKEKQSYSIKYLDYLWSKAVKFIYKNKCAICNSNDNLESHHIVPRKSNAVLRHDIKNGICLCKECHDKAETIIGRMKIYSIVDTDYLGEIERLYYKKEYYLKDFNLTEKKFRLKQYNILQDPLKYYIINVLHKELKEVDENDYK